MSKKKIFKSIIFTLIASILFFSGIIWAINNISYKGNLIVNPAENFIGLENMDNENPIDNEQILNSLIIETDISEEFPKNFRATTFYQQKTDIAYIPNLTGFESLRAAASGQFSESSLQNALKHLLASYLQHFAKENKQ